MQGSVNMNYHYLSCMQAITMRTVWYDAMHRQPTEVKGNVTRTSNDSGEFNNPWSKKIYVTISPKNMGGAAINCGSSSYTNPFPALLTM